MRRAGVEPAEEGFAFAVALVIDFEESAGHRVPHVQRREPGVGVAGGNLEDLGVGEFAFESRVEVVEAFG